MDGCDYKACNGRCFVSIMLHVPLEAGGETIYLSVSLGYCLWTKERSKLELAAGMVRSVMPEPVSCGQVFLLCDSWYPKKPVTGLAAEFKNREIICCAGSDTMLYDLPSKRTGKRRRPHIHGDRLELSSIALDKPKGAYFHLVCFLCAGT